MSATSKLIELLSGKKTKGKDMSKYSQWAYNATHNMYTAAHDNATVKKVPAGFYKFNRDSWGNPVAYAVPVRNDKVCKFVQGPLDSVLKEVRSFWDSNDAYEKLGITHKRSILLHGPAGCGKSSIIMGVVKDIADRGGIAIQVNDMDSDSFNGVLPAFRDIQGKSKVVAILEDIERHNRHEEHLLELLDGTSSVSDGVLFLSTTNKLESIPTRVRCRPSRIDTLIMIDYPVEQQRIEYVQFLAGELLNDEHITKIAKLTEGMSLADIKEVVISTYVFKRDIAESVARLSENKS